MYYYTYLVNYMSWFRNIIIFQVNKNNYLKTCVKNWADLNNHDDLVHQIVKNFGLKIEDWHKLNELYETINKMKPINQRKLQDTEIFFDNATKQSLNNLIVLLPKLHSYNTNNNNNIYNFIYKYWWNVSDDDDDYQKNNNNNNSKKHEIFQIEKISQWEQLIEIIMLNFYGIEPYLCMKLLLIHKRLKESDFAELLKLNSKVIHQLLRELKKRNFIQVDNFDDNDDEQEYYCINFTHLIEKIKYKFEKIRQQINVNEKRTEILTSVHCKNCDTLHKEAKDVFLTMSCPNCGCLDKLDCIYSSNVNSGLLDKFNLQQMVVTDLLKEIIIKDI